MYCIKIFAIYSLEFVIGGLAYMQIFVKILLKITKILKVTENFIETPFKLIVLCPTLIKNMCVSLKFYVFQKKCPEGRHIP